MSLDNPYFIIILIAVAVLFKLDIFANILNLSALKPDVPDAFKDVYDDDNYKKARDYTCETTRFGILEGSISLAFFLIFWLLGGFGWLDGLVRSWNFGEITTGLVAIGLLFVGSSLLSLPFEIYNTFIIEEKYGFNKTTPATFLADHLKGLALGLLIGAPVIALVLYFFTRSEMAWLYAWVAISSISLVMAYLAPRYLLPIFNKFTPLEDGELKTAIHEMSESCGFPLQEVSVMDGSKRSSKSNAFFTGFGKTKKIALFDTLVENHSVKELVAVLAHEIGHFKKKHIVQQMVFGVLNTGALFFLLSIFLKSDRLFAAFGVHEPSVAFGFIFFGILFKPINKVLSVIMAVWSRKNEYEADAYAAGVTGEPESLITALKKLSADNLSNLTPHPFYVFLSYSHPPVIERIRALRANAGA